MASFIERDGRWRALVRKRGTVKCATFDTKAAAKHWASTVERQIEEMKSSGVMQPGALTLGDLLDRYVREQYARKAWGKSKTADLARLKRDLGHHKAAELTSRHVVEYFQGRNDEGAGGVVISAQCGYLVGVLEIARSLWHLDVPVQAAQDARKALASVGMSPSRNAATVA